jgi:hypothetical protein
MASRTLTPLSRTFPEPGLSSRSRSPRKRRWRSSQWRAARPVRGVAAPGRVGGDRSGLPADPPARHRPRRSPASCLAVSTARLPALGTALVHGTDAPRRAARGSSDWCAIVLPRVLGSRSANGQGPPQPRNSRFPSICTRGHRAHPHGGRRSWSFTRLGPVYSVGFSPRPSPPGNCHWRPGCRARPVASTLRRGTRRWALSIAY